MEAHDTVVQQIAVARTLTMLSSVTRTTTSLVLRSNGTTVGAASFTGKLFNKGNFFFAVDCSVFPEDIMKPYVGLFTIRHRCIPRIHRVCLSGNKTPVVCAN